MEITRINLHSLGRKDFVSILGHLVSKNIHALTFLNFILFHFFLVPEQSRFRYWLDLSIHVPTRPRTLFCCVSGGCLVPRPVFCSVEHGHRASRERMHSDAHPLLPCSPLCGVLALSSRVILCCVAGKVGLLKLL